MNVTRGGKLKAYKLVRLKKNGSIGSLFINRNAEMPIGKWLEAENHPTKGFAERFGWHCCSTPYAPHLKENLKSGEKRIWVECEVEGITIYDRPESQGGKWILASLMYITRILSKDDVLKLL